MDLFLFKGQGVTTISWNVTGPQGMSLKLGPMCSPWEGNKPLSHKESINKVRGWLAVGINEIHPLLIDPSQPKGWLKEKATLRRGDKETLLWVYKESFLCFIVLGFSQPGGTSPVFVFTSLAPSEFPVSRTKMCCCLVQQHYTRFIGRHLQ